MVQKYNGVCNGTLVFTKDSTYTAPVQKCDIFVVSCIYQILHNGQYLQRRIDTQQLID